MSMHGRLGKYESMCLVTLSPRNVAHAPLPRLAGRLLWFEVFTAVPGKFYNSLHCSAARREPGAIVLCIMKNYKKGFRNYFGGCIVDI